MNQSIVFLKCLAALFITNSHYLRIYPDSLSYLATAGSLGNSIFFFVSGFTLINSHKTQFSRWYLKRLTRIYPPVILVTLSLYLLSGDVALWNFVYPTLYWFVNAIMIFYVIYYWVPKSGRSFLFVLILLFIPYFFIYFKYMNISEFVIETDYFRWIFYFQIMIFGGLLAKLNNPLKYRLQDGFVLFLLIVLYFVEKLVSLKYPALLSIQFLQHLLTFPIVYYLYLFAKSDFVINKLMNTRMKKVITGIASITLEIYLVQFFIIAAFSKIVFPLNLIIVSALIIVCAYIVHKVIQSLLNLSPGSSEPKTRESRG